jgi:hypothetical protein
MKTQTNKSRTSIVTEIRIKREFDTIQTEIALNAIRFQRKCGFEIGTPEFKNAAIEEKKAILEKLSVCEAIGEECESLKLWFDIVSDAAVC